MYKRIVILFAVLLTVLCVSIFQLYSIAISPAFKNAADKQNTDTLQIARSRGMIYDTKGNPLVNADYSQIAVLVPSKDSEALLNDLTKDNEERNLLLKKLKRGQPVSLNLGIHYNNIYGMETYNSPERYGKDQPAVHVIGYLNEAGEGIYGIERIFNSLLAKESGKLEIRYNVNALRAMLENSELKVINTNFDSAAGVVLTIDKEIQQITDDVLRKTDRPGAALVVEAKTGKIRALSSYPVFDPNHIKESINKENSPFINRVFCAYNVGSIFKICVTAAALEEGIPETETYNCTGRIKIGDRIFRCAADKAHGENNIETALSKSCNTFFIHLAQKLNQDQLLDIAKQFGFGTSYPIFEGIVPESGSLPTAEELKSKIALSSFAFGQGSLMATPVQIAQMIGGVVNGGKVLNLSLVESIVNNDGVVVESFKPKAPVQAISSGTSYKIMKYMVSVASEGTGKEGLPSKGGAGAKTATAETGWVKDGRKILQTWYAGFFPANNPKYIVVVLLEDGESGGKTCAPLFKEIADRINELEK